MGEQGEQVLWAAVGLAFIFEGIVPFAFPEAWRRMMQEMTRQSEMQIRFMGLTGMIIGLLVVLFS